MTNKNKLFKRKITRIALFLAIALVIVPFGNNCVSAKNIFSKKQIGIENKNFKKINDTQSTIDKYQAKYFTIIKRNNVLLNMGSSSELNKDRKDLKKLFKEVEKQISNKTYLKEYNKIEKHYSKCDAETTIEINEFAQKNYDEVDKLLNDVYKEVKAKISNEDFKNLTLSERKWLQEVRDYEKVFNSMNFGTIGTSVYYNYEINMRKFRTLLLMLYL